MSENMQQDWKHWRLRREDTGLAWLDLDKADSSTHVLSPDLLEEFARVLDVLDAAPPKALVIASAKPAGFIAGADIEEFSRLDSVLAARSGLIPKDVVLGEFQTYIDW